MAGAAGAGVAKGGEKPLHRIANEGKARQVEQVGRDFGIVADRAVLHLRAIEAIADRGSGVLGDVDEQEAAGADPVDAAAALAVQPGADAVSAKSFGNVADEPYAEGRGDDAVDAGGAGSRF